MFQADKAAVESAATVAQIRALPPAQRNSAASQQAMENAAKDLAAASGTSVVSAAARIWKALR